MFDSDEGAFWVFSLPDVVWIVVVTSLLFLIGVSMIVNALVLDKWMKGE